MKKIEYVMRIMHANYNTPEKLKGLINFCKKAGVYEVQLVPINAPFEPAFLSKKGIIKRCGELKRIIYTLETNGIEGNLAVVRTLYPLPAPEEENIGFSQPKIGADGTSDKLTPCPLDPVYRDYIRFCYSEYAKTNARSIIVDDDFRYEWVGPGTCFCPLHLSEFNKRFKHNVSRESLVKICCDTTISKIKQDWMDFKRQTLVKFAQELRESVHSINPKIRMGLMLTSTEISLYEGRDFQELVNAFAGNLKPLVRPGQGWYKDEKRTEFLLGLTDTVFQKNKLSDNTEIQAEVDVCPHTCFSKSTAVSLDYQIKANIACNIKKINIWPFSEIDKVDSMHPFADILKHNTKIFNSIAKIIPDNSVMRGVKVLYNLQTGILRDQTKKADMYGPKIPTLLWRFGIPYTFSESKALILSKNSFPLSKKEVKELLSKYNVLIDSNALVKICELGLDKLIGVKPGRVFSSKDSIYEYYVDNVLNGPIIKSLMSNSRRSQVATDMQYNKKEFTILTHIVNSKGKRMVPGIIASHKKNQRIVVLAYPISITSESWLNPARQSQMQSLLAWLCGGVLPAVVKGAYDLCPVVLEDDISGVKIISLINCSTMRWENFDLCIEANLPISKYVVSYVSNSGKIIDVSKRAIRKKEGSLYIKVSEEAGINSCQVRFFRIGIK